MLRRYAAAVGAALLALVSAGPATAAAQPPGEHYVAPGDSYTSGAGILPTADHSCTRSTRKYPSLVAAQLDPPSFTDVSCGGATTEPMWKPQNGAPPQLDALNQHPSLVTLGIGGNDIRFGEIIGKCTTLAASAPAGNPCEEHYRTADGGDELDQRIAETGPKVAAVLDAICERSPWARVLVVGYPVIVPHEGAGCWPRVPFADRDVPYLSSVEQRAKAMLAREARAHGAEFVDAYTPPSVTRCASRRSTDGSSPCCPHPPRRHSTQTRAGPPPWHTPWSRTTTPASKEILYTCHHGAFITETPLPGFPRCPQAASMR